MVERGLAGCRPGSRRRSRTPGPGSVLARSTYGRHGGHGHDGAQELEAVDIGAPVASRSRGSSGRSRAARPDPALVIRTLPRLSGRSWQIEAVKPEKSCRPSPIRSVEKVMKWTWMSGLASRAIGPEEGARIAGADRERPLAVERVAEAAPSAARRACRMSSLSVIGCVQPHHEADLQVVLESSRRRAAVVRRRRCRAPASSAAGPMPGELQELRRVDGAAGQDRPRAAPAPSASRPPSPECDPDGAPALEHDPRRERLRDDAQVRRARGRACR